MVQFMEKKDIIMLKEQGLSKVAANGILPAAVFNCKAWCHFLSEIAAWVSAELAVNRLIWLS